MAALAEFAAAARRLAGAVAALDAAAAPLGLAPASDRPWHETLHGKLLPQTGDDAFLVVAVVGGTNIGKSVVFNHLAGTKASASSPTASGTKHPTCLVPVGFGESHSLAEVFPGFTPVRVDPGDPAAALRADDRDLLFWDESPAVPANLLVLDTPDVDSDAPVNWARAAKVRTAADVLLAVLTNQKYNDAAVVRFFREAGDADAAVVVVFNQVLLPDDEPYWPEWVGTFAERTGIAPDFLYLAPHDRKAAEELRLPFFPRPWPPGEQGEEERNLSRTHASGLGGDERGEGADLSTMLSELHFGEVKRRTLRGAVDRLADRRAGVPAWLEEVRGRSGDFAAAAGRLAREGTVKEGGWPPVPASLLVGEVRRWWKGRRTGWRRSITTAYDAVNTGVAYPFRYLAGDRPDPIETYRSAEWSAVLRATEDLFDRLRLFAETGGDVLGPRFAAILDGGGRGDLLADLKARHEECDLREELETVVRREMEAFVERRPHVRKWLDRADTAAVAARPALSVVLLCGGAYGVDIAAGGFAANLVADLAAGTAATVGGDALVDKSAGGGLALVQAKLMQIQDRFAAGRAAWFADRVRAELLGGLPDELRTAAGLPEGPAFREVRGAVDALVVASGGRQPSVSPDAPAHSHVPEHTEG